MSEALVPRPEVRIHGDVRTPRNAPIRGNTRSHRPAASRRVRTDEAGGR